MQYKLLNVPANINPEFIELREINLEDLEQAQIRKAIHKELLRYKYTAQAHNFSNKWVWYRLIKKAKDIKRATQISEVYVSEFSYKPGLVKYLVEEFTKMSNKAS